MSVTGALQKTGSVTRIVNWVDINNVEFSMTTRHVAMRALREAWKGWKGERVI